MHAGHRAQTAPRRLSNAPQASARPAPDGIEIQRLDKRREHKRASASSQPMVAPALLNRQQAARYLGISERTLWTLTNIGEVIAVRIGGRVLYRVADLDAYVASLKPTKPPKTR